jgi:hypothetical protein
LETENRCSWRTFIDVGLGWILFRFALNSGDTNVFFWITHFRTWRILKVEFVCVGSQKFRFFRRIFGWFGSAVLSWRPLDSPLSPNNKLQGFVGDSHQPIRRHLLLPTMR